MGNVRMQKLSRRKRRHLRIRKKILGTAERPRLSVKRSLKHIEAQLIEKRHPEIWDDWRKFNEDDLAEADELMKGLAVQAIMLLNDASKAIHILD